jgi:ketosteroid isomerase-like protein
LKEKNMNEQENAGLVRQAYQSIKAGDIQSFLNLLAGDVQWQLPEMENVPFAGKWQGREEVREFFSKVFELQDVVEFEPKEFIAHGDKVVVLGRFSMRIKATGRIFGSDWAHVWTVKGGKVTHFYEYVDTAAVGRAHTAAQSAAKTANKIPAQEVR